MEALFFSCVCAFATTCITQDTLSIELCDLSVWLATGKHCHVGPPGSIFLYCSIEIRHRLSEIV